MKRFLALLVVVIMLFSLVACGENKGGNSTDTSTTTTTESGTIDTSDTCSGTNNDGFTDGTQGSTQGKDKDSTGREDNTTGDTNNFSPTKPTSDSVGSDNTDKSYLLFEKQGGGYCVTGIDDNGPQSIIIPATYKGLPVTHIGSWAFAYNEKITSITISNNVLSIGECAFEQCYNLKNISIGNGVSTIEKGAFRCCTSLKSINIPGNVKTINETAFEGCSKLSSITLSSGVQKIGNSVFVGTALTNVKFPSSVTSMGEGVFNSCEQLTSVIIGDGISKISNGAFSYCNKLTSVAISKSVKSIDAYAFYLCENLKSISFAGTKSAWKSIKTGESWNYGVPATTISCSDGTINLNGGTTPTTPTPSTPTPTQPQPNRVTGVKLDKTSLSLMVGNTQQLTATVLPSNADNKNITWSSSNSSIAQVSSSGKVTAKGEGSAIITVTTKDGSYTASCRVTVSVIHVNGVSLNKTTLDMTVGKSQQLTATVSPSNAANKNITWSSSNSSVAQVSSSGKVTAKGKGSATITVTTADGNFTATCKVTVTEPPLTVSASIGVGYYMSSTGSVRGVFAEAKASGGSGNYVEYYVKVYYNGKLVAEGAKNEIIVTLANGTYTAEVYVKDSNGNEATSTKSMTLSGY